MNIITTEDVWYDIENETLVLRTIQSEIEYEVPKDSDIYIYLGIL